MASGWLGNPYKWASWENHLLMGRFSSAIHNRRDGGMRLMNQDQRLKEQWCVIGIKKWINGSSGGGKI